ncbi:MAG: tetratricopeptide repeat protein [Verrucomicrobiota bacterium]|nr:tetratricopeptide repeat protein [Verrucomicrobiota bacterium]
MRSSVPLAIYVFAAVLLVRLFVLLRFSASAFLLPSQGDMHFYNDWALRILSGQWTDHQAFYGLPLYPYLLAALYKVIGNTPFVPAFFQACADSGTAAILFKLAVHLSHRRGDEDNEEVVSFWPLRRGECIGLLAAAGWCFYVPAQAYSVILMPTALAIFIFWFVVWQIVRRAAAPRPALIFLFGVLIGFTAMGIATTLFLVPLFLAALFLKWSDRSRGQLLRATLLGALLLTGVGLGTLPCWAHNYFVARDPVLLSAHSGVNFWIGNNPLANGYPKMPPGLHAGQEAMLQDSIHVAERNLGHPLKRGEVSRYWSAKANLYIRENPGAWLRLVGTKMANFWNSFQYDDLSIITNLRLQGVLLPGIKFGLIAALALAAFPFVAVRVPQSRWIIAAILLHMGSLLTVFVTERYRMAAVPGLLLLGAFGLSYAWEHCSRAHYRGLVGYAAALVLATLLVSVPRRDPSLWALDPYNSGWQALQSHNYSLAKEKLELAYAYVPENAEINFALGNLQLELGDVAGAKPYYAATLRLDPEHEGAWNNLGVLALGESRWELASKFFRGALRISPDDPKTQFLLARAYTELGNYAAARAELASALRSRPGQREFLELQDRIARAL